MKSDACNLSRLAKASVIARCVRQACGTRAQQFTENDVIVPAAPNRSIFDSMIVEEDCRFYRSSRVAFPTSPNAVLDPHFERENQIALPPLGLLAPLAAGQTPAGLQHALAMTDALRKELPRMLEEHRRIRAATEKLRIAARAEKAPVHERLAETLAAHAQTEEEVLYPAVRAASEMTCQGRIVGQ